MVAEEIPENLRVPPQRHRAASGIGAGKSPKTHQNKRPLDLAAKQRAERAMELRDEGTTLEEIARILGYASRGAAHNAIDRELDRMIEHTAKNLRKRENRRLDRIEAVVIPIALSGDPSKSLWAVDRVLTIQARRAKLNGLDLDREEIMAAMPYQKRIVLEDSPAQPLLEAGN
jgi:hypothetical protein